MISDTCFSVLRLPINISRRLFTSSGFPQPSPGRRFLLSSRLNQKVYAPSRFHRGECTTLPCRLDPNWLSDKMIKDGSFLFSIIVKIVEDVVLIVWDDGFMFHGVVLWDVYYWCVNEPGYACLSNCFSVCYLKYRNYRKKSGGV